MCVYRVIQSDNYVIRGKKTSAACTATMPVCYYTQLGSSLIVTALEFVLVEYEGLNKGWNTCRCNTNRGGG